MEGIPQQRFVVTRHHGTFAQFGYTVKLKTVPGYTYYEYGGNPSDPVKRWDSDR